MKKVGKITLKDAVILNDNEMKNVVGGSHGWGVETDVYVIHEGHYGTGILTCSDESGFVKDPYLPEYLSNQAYMVCCKNNSGVAPSPDTGTCVNICGSDFSGGLYLDQFANGICGA